MTMRTWLALTLVAAASPLAAQEVPPTQQRTPVIQVTGTGSVSVKPDMANLNYTVEGEGKTADDASRALAAKQKAVSAGLSDLLGAGTQVTAGQVNLSVTRGRDCNSNGYDPRPQLSEGPCAPTGYIASLQGNVRTGAVDKAATAVGLAARLGARNAQVSNFFLANPSAAQTRANTAAIADARAKAAAMAAGAGVRLGTLLSLVEQAGGMPEMVVSGYRNIAEALPPPAPVPPPVVIDTTPRPIELQGRVIARFEILP
jgi:uncharacterized protein